MAERDETLALLLGEWRTQANERPLRILVVGKTGAGKSALINNLLGAQLCPEGFGFDAVSTRVNKVETELNGVRIEIFDTPGLKHVQHRSDESIMAEISAVVGAKASNELDVFFYCKPVTERGTEEDERILRLFPSTFGSKLWKRGIIVLTRANQVVLNNKSEYQRGIKQFGEKLKSVLRNQANVEEAIVKGIPVLTAGYTESVIPCEFETHNDSTDDDISCPMEPNWKTRLVLAALDRADPKFVPAIFEITLRNVWTGTGGLTCLEEAVAATSGAFVTGGIATLLTMRCSGSWKNVIQTATAIGIVSGGPVLSGMKDIRRLLRLKFEMWRFQLPD